MILVGGASTNLYEQLQAWGGSGRLAAASDLETVNDRLNRDRVALALIDRHLFGHPAETALREMADRRPDLGIIIAAPPPQPADRLSLIRAGADDWLSPPINVDQLKYTVAQVLLKRKQIIEDRLIRRDLQITNLRTQFLHHLILKMNSGYLTEMELEVVLQTILIGITSAEGLAFNRAFLALFDKDNTLLRGELAIGPDSQADAQAIWEEIKSEKLDLQGLFLRSSDVLSRTNGVVNSIVKSLAIPAGQAEHPLIRACSERRTILVENGRADIAIPQELVAALSQDSFIIVPLYSSDRSLGVIIADNQITGKPIEQSDVKALEIFAGQASLAIEHSHLHRDMQKQIHELELITDELEKSRDMLVESDRYIALGQMSAQLVHTLRNPITSIGGTARLLEKRISGPLERKFLKVLIKESVKVESTLNDLFNFVSDTELAKSEQSVFNLVRRAVMAFYGAMKKQGISYHIEFPDKEPLLDLDGDRIYQAILHLIRNSLDSMDEGGTLSVGAEILPDSLLVSISDTGSGLINGDLNRVTDPFYTTKTYGTGMGLTLVEQILNQHGASFSLTTNEDQGMTATVRFPLPCTD